jgi:hypothetical protein
MNPDHAANLYHQRRNERIVQSHLLNMDQCQRAGPAVEASTGNLIAT